MKPCRCRTFITLSTLSCTLPCLLLLLATNLPSVLPLALPATPHSTQPPKLFVFDLDNTLWTPELYQLPPDPPPNAVKLFDDVSDILTAIMDRFPESKIAIASRTKSGDLARQLLPTFVPLKGNKVEKTIFAFVEIRTGDKTVHFKNLANQSAIDLSEMVFFDDALSGRYGNCVPVSKMGVTVGYCPKGMNMDVSKAILVFVRSLSHNILYSTLAADLREPHD